MKMPIIKIKLISIRGAGYMELDSKFEKLIKKQAEYKSSNLGLNLLISRLQRKYSFNQTPEELEKCLCELSLINFIQFLEMT